MTGDELDLLVDLHADGARQGPGSDDTTRLALTLTWLTHERPAELAEHWNREYPEVDTAAETMGVLESSGCAPLGHFPLPERCWLREYYRPLQQRFAAFLDRHDHSGAARSLVDAEQREIDLYERYSPYVGYGFYVAKRTDG